MLPSTEFYGEVWGKTERVEALLQSADTNKAGVISRAEFEQNIKVNILKSKDASLLTHCWLQRTRVQLSDNEMKALVNMADPNQTGAVLMLNSVLI